MDPTKNTKNDNTLLRSQLFVPPLQYGILAQTLNETTKTVRGVVCVDKPGWMSSLGKPCSDYSIVGASCTDIGQDGTTAHESCRIACNNCPAHINLVKEKGGTYDRLPSPIEEAPEPNFSSLLTDDNWKIGETKDIGQNPDISNKLDDIDQKLDELRKNIPEPFCTCSDIKSNLFGPSRCSGADLSDDFEWKDIRQGLPSSSLDTDRRHGLQCKNNYDYTQGVGSLIYTDDDENHKRTITYNCTSQRWETKGHKRSDPYVPYRFPDGMIHCESKSPGALHVSSTKLATGQWVKAKAATKAATAAATAATKAATEAATEAATKAATAAAPGLTKVTGLTKVPGLTKASLSSSTSPKPCSQNWLEKIFDEDDCIPTTDADSDADADADNDKTEVTGLMVIFWIFLSMASLFCGYIIYIAHGNIALYIAMNLGAIVIYSLVRFGGYL
jgi:hypothetical protein